MALVLFEHGLNGSIFDGEAIGQARGRRDWVYSAADIVISVALLSLFLPIKLSLGFVQVRPFDFLTTVLFLMVLSRLHKLPAPSSWVGFGILLPYLVWHVASAFRYTEQDGVREALQVAIITSFAFSVCVLLPVLRFRRMFPLLLIGMAAITAYNVYFHISAGQWFGWKNLGTWSSGDIKFTFKYLPPLVGLLIVFTRGRLIYFAWLIWIVLGAVILMSGERKAFLVYGLLSAALLARARIHFAVPLLVVAYFTVSWISTQLERGYLSQQLSSITTYTSIPGQDIFELIVRGASPATPSDSQRIFAFHVGGELLQDHWLLGVGTNAYADLVWQKYYYAPRTLLVGIHGEFWRVLVENGIVGLFLYVLIWASAAYRLFKKLLYMVRAGAIGAYPARMLFLFILLPPGFSVAFEAPGTHAFIALMLASFSPEIVHYSLQRSLRRALAFRRDAD